MQEIVINQGSKLTATSLAKFSLILRGEKGKLKMSWLVYHPGSAAGRKIKLELSTQHMHIQNLLKTNQPMKTKQSNPMHHPNPYSKCMHRL